MNYDFDLNIFCQWGSHNRIIKTPFLAYNCWQLLIKLEEGFKHFKFMRTRRLFEEKF